MNKKMLILAMAAGALSFSSCKQASSINYNDTVVKMYSSYTSRLGKDLTEISNSTMDVTKRTAAANEMEQLTDSCTKVLNSMTPVEEAKDFHNKMLAVYTAVKTDIVPISRKFAALSKPEENVDAYNKLVDEMNTASTKLDHLETATQVAQAEFAKKVNMEVH